jgi:hypothetical protein
MEQLQKEWYDIRVRSCIQSINCQQALVCMILIILGDLTEGPIVKNAGGIKKNGGRTGRIYTWGVDTRRWTAAAGGSAAPTPFFVTTP